MKSASFLIEAWTCGLYCLLLVVAGIALEFCDSFPLLRDCLLLYLSFEFASGRLDLFTSLGRSKLLRSAATGAVDEGKDTGWLGADVVFLTGEVELDGSFTLTFLMFGGCEDVLPGTAFAAEVDAAPEVAVFACAGWPATGDISGFVLFGATGTDIGDEEVAVALVPG